MPQTATAPPEHTSLASSTPPKPTPLQWRTGLAAWLGWMFDGLDMHLYTLVATPFVAQLLAQPTTSPSVAHHASIIQAAFLLGWALGGGFFGILGDRLGRARALSLTVLTYALFTGLSFFATEWWHLMAFRFLAALGIGGEWAVGACLLAETWPPKWRPWIAAVLQTGVNVGILAAGLASFLLAYHPPRYLFLVGILPALLVLWIRRHVPEPPEWHVARQRAATSPPLQNSAFSIQNSTPTLRDLFSPSLRSLTLRVMLVCALSLTAHWAFMFWHLQHLRTLPDVLEMSPADQTRLASLVMYLVIGSSIVGNFASAAIARRLGYRTTIAATFLAYFLIMSAAYLTPRTHHELLWWFPAIGFCQGVFGLFTMYLPPLFPTLLRTTGSGFCYNIGRTAAAAGTIFFGLLSPTNDQRTALLAASLLFLPASLASLLLPNTRD